MAGGGLEICIKGSREEEEGDSFSFFVGGGLSVLVSFRKCKRIRGTRAIFSRNWFHQTIFIASYVVRTPASSCRDRIQGLVSHPSTPPLYKFYTRSSRQGSSR